jgi:hypothetical protein
MGTMGYSNIAQAERKRLIELLDSGMAIAFMMAIRFYELF